MRSRPQTGFALIATLVALSMLLALAVPFVLAMSNGDAVSYQLADQKRVDLLSRSARDIVLSRASDTRRRNEELTFDGRSEFPDHLELPEGMQDLAGSALDRNLLSAEVEDVQRRINLNTATPLLLANLLGLVTRLREDYEDDATEIEVGDNSAFPAQGYLLIDRELIHYTGKRGGAFTGLERGLNAVDKGFTPADKHNLERETLVIDFRCVLAVVQSFYYDPDGRRDTLRRFGSVEQVNRIRELGFGAFSNEQLDVLRRTCTVASVRERAADWGKPERLFAPVALGPLPWQERALRVRSATDIPAGSVVRIRSLDGSQVEYGLVWGSRIGGRAGFDLPSQGWTLYLLRPPSRELPELDTVVEALLPHPVNVNTASPELLAALMQNVRAGRLLPHGQGTLSPFSRSEARQMADDLVALRAEDGGQSGQLPRDLFANAEIRPFESFQDLSQRFFFPLMDAADNRERDRLMLLYRSMLGNATGDLEMATAPLQFTSAPVVSYRAAAAKVRGSRLAARLERSGFAVTMPSHTLDFTLWNQADFERAFRLDRRAPFYTTWPIHLGTFLPTDASSNPLSRHYAHLLAKAAPGIGFGEPRFPARDGNDDGFQLATASTPFGYRRRGVQDAYQSMWSERYPEGRDVTKDGPYLMFNNGPRAVSRPGQSTTPQKGPGGSRAHDQAFPFSGVDGLTSRFGISFWFQAHDGGDQMLFDVVGDRTDRNRISLKLEQQELVFEVLDEAGLDEYPSLAQQAGTAPERTAGTWKVPLQDFGFQPDLWYHVNLSADGNRPGQLSLLIDGVPRGEPQLRTRLTRPIVEYTRPRPQPEPFFQDPARYFEIYVEDTEGFPDRGVLRIGLELFEYTSKTASSFLCTFRDSIGGRVARMNLQEYLPEVPLDENGRPQINVPPTTTPTQGTAPPHDAGVAVELYGYTVPVYRNYNVQFGSNSLATALGPFAVARVVNQSSLDSIQVGRLNLGRGLMEGKSTDLELGNPEPVEENGNYPGRLSQAKDDVLGAFSTAGGYALLMQRHFRFNYTGRTAGENQEMVVGGIELIRYGSRDGNMLRGIQRAVPHPAGQTDPRGIYDGRSHNYVFDWNKDAIVLPAKEKRQPNNLYSFTAYVVPVSIPVNGGNLADPTVLGRTEWCQILPAGSGEQDTEWVRYDVIAENKFVMRGNVEAWRRTLGVVTGGSLDGGEVSANDQGATVTNVVEPTVAAVKQWGTDYIGYTDSVEVDHPVVAPLRANLQFRGDGVTGTTSHAQVSGASVLPVHRFELDWGAYGALSGRAGRDDRIALIEGSQADGTNRPQVEWHTVNWAVRRRWPQPQPQAGQAPSTPGKRGVNANAELVNAYPVQLVAFKEPVDYTGFVGLANRNFLVDTRRVDRMVKFPSGELPAIAVEDAYFGATPQRDLPALRGVIDDLEAVQRRHLPPKSDPPGLGGMLLDEPLADGGGGFVVRPDLLVTPQGDVTFKHDLTSALPQGGGLVMIDGEILAYSAVDNGRFQIAENGRGLLGTEPTAHDEGAMVYFLDHVPAAILDGGVSEHTAELVVKDIGDLPPHGGTLLLGRTELLHYAWTAGGKLLGMPEWHDPDSPRIQGRGLLRGRYGTTPVSASSGEPVIWFPFRYWDRFHERADDPEMAYLQVTWNLAPAYFQRLLWDEDQIDNTVGVQCYVRVDDQASWADDPEHTPALYRFDNGRPQQQPNWIGRQGSRLEARFYTVYRSGCFDAQTFLAQSWKRAPRVKRTTVFYEGESRILSERITAQ